MNPTRRSLLRTAVATALAGAVWLPALHWMFGVDLSDLADPEAPLPPLVEGLLARHLAVWEGTDEAAIAALRRTNAEWDFMGRTFLVLALTELSLRRPGLRARLVPVVDRIVADTVAVERDLGQTHFLMGYATARPFVHPSGRSVFVDGEIALMAAARLLLGPHDDTLALLRERSGQIARQLRDGPVLCAESYPDECWTFCNTTALAALRLGDAVRGTEHGALVARWVDTARSRLVDGRTGLLISSFRLDGAALDGPEGSSIWFSAHNLRWLDDDLARDQYARARVHLGRAALGFGWSREWPASWRGPTDVDSGPIVPVLDASPGASGLALVGAGAFDDADWLQALLASVRLAAFPTREGEGIALSAGNQVGDAVLLYALVQGRLREAVGAGIRA